MDGKVKVVPFRRNIAFYEGFAIYIVGMCIDVDLFSTVVVVGFGIECSHASVLEAELSDVEVG